MAAAEARIGPGGRTVLLLVEGYCSLAIEMIALRVLAPVAGQSVGVTSIVVTAFLAALALGYRSGGRFLGEVREKLGWNLAAAAAWSAFWLSRFGVALAFEATGWMPPLWQVGVYAAVGVGPAAYLLAETVVLLVGGGSRETAAGKAGSAFSASTLGNVAGGLVTALLVMQHLGVGVAVALVSALLLFAALGAWGRLDWRVCAPGIAAAAVCGANVAAERDAFVLTTSHADYAIEVDDGGARHLRVNGQNASRDDGGGIGHRYIEWIEDRVYGNLPEDRPGRVLVIGAGGFTFGRGRPDAAAEIVYVDVDDLLDEVARAFLAPSARSVTYAAMDGRAYLLRNEREFDAIVLDAYADRTRIPPHLVTREFFGLARSRLGEDGTLYLNLIVPPGPERLAARIERTLRSVFAWCRTHAAGEGSRWHNLVFACARSKLDGDLAVYSDGGSRGEVDGLPARGRP